MCLLGQTGANSAVPMPDAWGRTGSERPGAVRCAVTCRSLQWLADARGRAGRAVSVCCRQWRAGRRVCRPAPSPAASGARYGPAREPPSRSAGAAPSPATGHASGRCAAAAAGRLASLRSSPAAAAAACSRLALFIWTWQSARGEGGRRRIRRHGHGRPWSRPSCRGVRRAAVRLWSLPIGWP